MYAKNCTNPWHGWHGTSTHPGWDANVELRPTWDQIWMEMAFLLASRSIDPRTKVGAIIVTGDNTRVLAVGYNGDHKGGSNTVDSTEPGMSGCIHAEENALIKMDYNDPKPKTMYLTVSPCLMCAKKIINAGINEVVYENEYRITDGIDTLSENGVQIRRYERDS